MSRAPRINFHNCWYHVMNRGAGFKKIFFTNQDCEKFLFLLEKITEQYEIEIHAYCLMRNHYHLLVKTPLPNLSSAIRYLNSMYARYFNHTRQTDGPLFRGRFKSTVVSDNQYLLFVSRYIHLNPVKSKIVQTALQYKWSSFQFYLQPNLTPSFLKTDEILKQLLLYFPHLTYEEYMCHLLGEKFESFCDDDFVTIFGEKSFGEVIQKIKSTRSKEISRIQGQREISIQDIKREVAKFYNIPMKSIDKAIALKENIPRAVAMWLSRSIGKYSLREIATAFHNKSYASVSISISRLKEKGVKDIRLLKEITTLEQKLTVMCYN